MQSVRCKKESFSLVLNVACCVSHPLRQPCSRLLTARWPTSASTAAWRRLRCCEFSSTSSKSKTAPTTLPSTSCTPAEVSESRRFSSGPVCSPRWSFKVSDVHCRASEAEAQRLPSGAQGHTRSMRAGLQSLPDGGGSGRGSHLRCKSPHFILFLIRLVGRFKEFEHEQVYRMRCISWRNCDFEFTSRNLILWLKIVPPFHQVAQYIKFEMPVLQSFITKLKEEEDREVQKLRRRYEYFFIFWLSHLLVSVGLKNKELELQRGFSHVVKCWGRK